MSKRGSDKLTDSTNPSTPETETTSGQVPKKRLVANLSKTDILQFPNLELNRSSSSQSAANKSDNFVDVIENELKCPICFQLMDNPYATVCSHSFCHKCLLTNLKFNDKCPKCSCLLDSPGKIFPNFNLGNLAKKCREINVHLQRLHAEVPSSSQSSPSVDDLVKNFVSTDLDLQTIYRLIEMLQQKRLQLEDGDKYLRYRLLKEFLNEMIVRRRQINSRLNSELQVLERDLKITESCLSAYTAEAPLVPSTVATNNGEFSEDVFSVNIKDVKSSGHSLVPCSSNSVESPSQNTNNASTSVTQSLMQRRVKLKTHFEDLESQYLSYRHPANGLHEPSDSPADLEKMINNLTKMTQYSNFKLVGTLAYNADTYGGLSIVSSIEFDRDGELFTVAGVTKKIKLYDFNIVLQDAVDIHYPVCEMQCTSKISCVSWNPYNRFMLASSDYEGIVQLWDVNSGTSIKKYQEHEKRCWSICFNYMDPNIMASGSDDAKVKIWAINNRNSIQTIEADVNVCCVHFNPESRYHLAFGSADHGVHYYDLRNAKLPVAVYQGHKKAVSYVKFLNSREIVSASTDSNLRLWSVDSGLCTRIFRGHQNEKNFVGLGIDNDFLACGSENNYLYIYYKELSRPLMSYSFGVGNSLPARNAVDPDSSDFVSAVCWKKKSNMVLAANSLGTIKILELI